MLIQRFARIQQVLVEEEDYQELDCQLLHPTPTHGELGVKVINYPELTGYCQVGDYVLLNGTAQHLQLGTGGYDFVRLRLPERGAEAWNMMDIYEEKLGLLHQGHIMKLRYTPLQLAVFTWEEQHQLNQENMLCEEASSIHTPMLVTSLHSMLPLLVLVIKEVLPSCRIAYIMTDGSALPIALSKHVRICKQAGLVDLTITCGQAFGGDLETVTLYSAIQAAYQACDVVIIGDGPGVVGTNTQWGTTGILTGEYLNAIAALGGKPLFVPRIQGVDSRQRHQGISHHTITVLTQLTPYSVTIPIPDEASWYKQVVSSSSLMSQQEVKKQIAMIGEKRREKQLPAHQWQRVLLPAFSELEKLLSSYPIPISTMGRELKDDPTFFGTVFASAYYVIEELERDDTGRRKDEE